jgi:hypothetical protein
LKLASDKFLLLFLNTKRVIEKGFSSFSFSAFEMKISLKNQKIVIKIKHFSQKFNQNFWSIFFFNFRIINRNKAIK